MTTPLKTIFFQSVFVYLPLINIVYNKHFCYSIYFFSLYTVNILHNNIITSADFACLEPLVKNTYATDTHPEFIVKKHRGPTDESFVFLSYPKTAAIEDPLT